MGETERVNEEVGDTVCVNEAEVHISENEEEDDEVLQNSEVHAIVYAYCVPRGDTSRSEKAPPYYDPDLHGTPVYVGQTMYGCVRSQEGEEEDDDHRSLIVETTESDPRLGRCCAHAAESARVRERAVAALARAQDLDQVEHRNDVAFVKLCERGTQS